MNSALLTFSPRLISVTNFLAYGRWLEMALVDDNMVLVTKLQTRSRR